MKRAFIVLLAFVTTSVYGQFSKKEDEIMKIIRSRDSIPAHVFLDSTVLPNMKASVSNTKRYWVYTGKDANDLTQLFDIRAKFETHDSALWFHKEYLHENSEGGPRVKKHGMKVPGAEEFMVYRAPEMLSKMVAVSGHQMFCYLFVVDNYFVKIYIVCDKDLKVNQYQNLAVEAVRRIKG